MENIKRRNCFFLQAFLLGSIFVQASLFAQESPAGVMIGNTQYNAEELLEYWKNDHREVGGVVEKFVQETLNNSQIKLWFRSIYNSLTNCSVGTDGTDIIIPLHTELFGFQSIAELLKKKCPGIELDMWKGSLFHEYGHIINNDVPKELLRPKVLETAEFIFGILVFHAARFALKKTCTLLSKKIGSNERIKKIRGDFEPLITWLNRYPTVMDRGKLCAGFLLSAGVSRIAINCWRRSVVPLALAVHNQFTEFRADDAIPSKPDLLRGKIFGYGKNIFLESPSEKKKKKDELCILSSRIYELLGRKGYYIKILERDPKAYLAHPTHQERLNRFKQRLSLAQKKRPDSEIRSLGLWLNYSWAGYPLCKYFIAIGIEKILQYCLSNPDVLYLIRQEVLLANLLLV